MRHCASHRIAVATGVVSTPPIIAGLATTAVYLHDPTTFGGGLLWYGITMLLLTVAPLMSYVLSYALPSIRELGRKGQRKLAFIVSVLSYVLGTIVCVCGRAPQVVLGFFLSYLASGGLLSVINGVLGFKASGHACGFAGPMTIMTAVIGPSVLWVWITLPLVFWARLRTKRHSMAELISGTLVGTVASAAVMVSIM